MAETNNYAEDAADAAELIAEFGQTGTLSRPTSSGPGFNPVPGAPLSYPVSFAVMSFSKRDVDGTRILASDKKVIMSAVGLVVEPRTSDKLLIGGKAHGIESIAPLNPAGTVVYYQLQCRS